MRFADLFRRTRQTADAIGGFLYLALFVVFIVQVVARFVFDKPLPWSDELAVILYIWVILWGAAFMVPEREHVVFDLVYQLAPQKLQALMRLLAHLMVGGLAAWALPASWSYISFMAREGTPVLGMPFMWVFLPFALLLLSLVVRGLVGIVANARELLGYEK